MSSLLDANLEKYQLPFPEAIFELEFFKNKPEPFFEVRYIGFEPKGEMLTFVFFPAAGQGALSGQVPPNTYV